MPAPAPSEPSDRVARGGAVRDYAPLGGVHRALELEGGVVERRVSRHRFRVADDAAGGRRRRAQPVHRDGLSHRDRRFLGVAVAGVSRARPAWLAGLSVAVALPAAAHCLEFAALRAGHATHIKTGMVVSVVISIGSLLLNLGLMRRGLLVTGDERRFARLRFSAYSRGAGRHVPEALTKRSDMKTLHLTNYWHAESGGIATFYRELLRQAESEGRSIRLVVPDAEDGVGSTRKPWPHLPGP